MRGPNESHVAIQLTSEACSYPTDIRSGALEWFRLSLTTLECSSLHAHCDDVASPPVESVEVVTKVNDDAGSDLDETGDDKQPPTEEEESWSPLQGMVSK